MLPTKTLSGKVIAVEGGTWNTSWIYHLAKIMVSLHSPDIICGEYEAKHGACQTCSRPTNGLSSALMKTMKNSLMSRDFRCC